MAIYEKDNVATNDGELTQIEIPLYGSSRLGMWRPLRPLEGENWELFETNPAPGTSGVRPEEFVRGRIQYELSNHLGNVLVTISDNRILVDNGTYSVMTVCPSCLPGYPCIPCYNHYERDSDTEDGIVDHYTAHVLTANDYYPFGMEMPGRVHRSLGAGGYRYRFNGKENDNEVKGEGNQQDYGMRIYDPKIVRFLSVDPISAKYPELTPYQFASNRPVDGIDEDGLEHYSYNGTYIVHDNIPRVSHVGVTDLTMRKAATPVLPANMKVNEIAVTRVNSNPVPPRQASIGPTPTKIQQVAELEKARTIRQIQHDINMETLPERAVDLAKDVIETPFREFDQIKSSLDKGDFGGVLEHGKNFTLSVAPYTGILKYGKIWFG